MLNGSLNRRSYNRCTTCNKTDMVTGTHFAYYRLCRRKLWLFANGLNMEHTSELVADGKLIHETSYSQRSEKFSELEIGGVKIDYYDAHRRVIHETKRGNSAEDAHIGQLKYYIYVLKQHGIDGVVGILEYPKLKLRKEVYLSEEDSKVMEDSCKEIKEIIASDACPEKIKMKLCKNCSYYDFCWSGEAPHE